MTDTKPKPESRLAGPLAFCPQGAHDDVVLVSGISVRPATAEAQAREAGAQGRGV